MKSSCASAVRGFNCVIGSTFPEHNPHAFAPVLIDAEQFPFNLRREIAQNGIRRWMHVQRRSNQQQQRFLRRDFVAGELS